MFSKILVALDLSQAGVEVFHKAVAIAQRMNAQLMLLHVLSPVEDAYPNVPLTPGLDAYYPNLHRYVNDEYVKLWATYEKRGLEQLQQWADEAIAAGVPTELTQNAGDAGKVICAIAQRWQADLILMGRRGRSGFKEMMLGSVSNYVLHHAPCSVLVVQGQSADETVLTESSEQALANHS
jgi:nucleotide-binding universal stress UspA family protein